MKLLFDATQRQEIRRCRTAISRLQARADQTGRKFMVLTVRALRMMAKDTIWLMYLRVAPVGTQPRERVEALLSIT